MPTSCRRVVARARGSRWKLPAGRNDRLMRQQCPCPDCFSSWLPPRVGEPGKPGVPSLKRPGRQRAEDHGDGHRQPADQGRNTKHDLSCAGHNVCSEVLQVLGSRIERRQSDRPSESAHRLNSLRTGQLGEMAKPGSRCPRAKFAAADGLTPRPTGAPPAGHRPAPSRLGPPAPTLLAGSPPRRSPAFRQSPPDIPLHVRPFGTSMLEWNRSGRARANSLPKNKKGGWHLLFCSGSEPENTAAFADLGFAFVEKEPSMALARECGRPAAHLSNFRKRRGFSGLQVAESCGGRLYPQSVNPHELPESGSSSSLSRCTSCPMGLHHPERVQRAPSPCGAVDGSIKSICRTDLHPSEVGPARQMRLRPVRLA